MFNPEEFRHPKQFVLSQKDHALSEHLPLVLERVPGFETVYYAVGTNGKFVVTVSGRGSNEEVLDFCISEMAAEEFLTNAHPGGFWGEAYNLPVLNADFATAVLNELRSSGVI